MYQKVDTDFNFAIRELPVLNFWKENKIFELSMSNKPKDAPVYSFYDGPPTANGKPHIGHVLTRAIKDAVPRYRTMQGCRVLRKAGWDTHGLPVELEVEKELNINGKLEIETFGIGEFIEKCKESVWVYEGFWKEMSERVAFWADMEQPYVTYHNSYIESVWWALSEIWKRDLIYKGYRIVPYCPRCGTPLSSHEVAQGYEEVTEISVIVKFRMKDADNTYFLAWTTTPWTLPSNIALCVNPEEEYVRVQKGDEIYVMAKELVDRVLEKDYEILDTKLGKEWIGVAYYPLFPYAEPLLDTRDKYCTITADKYVTLTDGTGIVHQAPAFGEDDARVCKMFGLPFVNLVNEQGKFIEEVTPWANMFVKDADEKIVAVLKDSGKLFKAFDYTHDYPFCWRCKTPLLYYPREAWFIRMTSVREQLLENNDTINWMPDNIRIGRFGNFLENVVDWSVSRERYWGTPLPIWECRNCEHQLCVGSITELKNMAINLPEDIDLHKPHIDKVLLKCPKCDGEMLRVPEVIDCWFDAGSMPFAQWHYPFENKEVFEENFPADFISEAVDQTRGWFYALIAISTLLFKRAPYKNVIVLGHVQDEKGQKLSKSLGNYIDPMETLAKHGADAVRWYFYINSAPWLNTKFSDDAVTDAQRRFMGTIWNTYAFYVLYANLAEFNPADYELDYEKLSVMDLWILSRLHSLVKKVDKHMDKYELTESARALNQFADELSNWYVRRCRKRFWNTDFSQDTINAYMTLNHVLVTFSKLIAPFVPYMAEQMYRNLFCEEIEKRGAPLSVHLCQYPEANEQFINPALESDMEKILQIVELGRSARNTAKIKNRQPLSEIFIGADENNHLSKENGFKQIILEELNVKAINFVNHGETEQYTQYRFKPQLRTLGPRYGKLVSQITEILNADANANMKSLKQGILRLDINGVEVELHEEDVLVETGQKDGFIVQSDRGFNIVLDIRLTDDLIEEGYVRELISKLQTMRKEAGFDVPDHIHVRYGKNERLDKIISRNYALIAEELLAEDICLFTDGESDTDGYYSKNWQINDQQLTLWVKKSTAVSTSDNYKVV